jgi:hypothetical protein
MFRASIKEKSTLRQQSACSCKVKIASGVIAAQTATALFDTPYAGITQQVQSVCGGTAALSAHIRRLPIHLLHLS